MKVELQKKFLERWSEWLEFMSDEYKADIKSGKVKCFLPMVFGIEVGEGWHGILWRCFEDIEKILGEKYKHFFKLVQIKEKFGGLRIYTGRLPCSKAMRLWYKADTYTRRFCYAVFPSRIAWKINDIISRPAERVLELFDIGRRIDKRISRAVRLSFKTCEVCGKPGEPRGPGWILTLCEQCRKENK